TPGDLPGVCQREKREKEIEGGLCVIFVPDIEKYTRLPLGKDEEIAKGLRIVCERRGSILN
ncbi:MAG: hypothetical protein IJX71_04995, partial [Oscillospiraceae bacterium]|nr:hypothetical protein [Oscillospiraceae bacterium]